MYKVQYPVGESAIYFSKTQRRGVSYRVPEAAISAKGVSFSSGIVGLKLLWLLGR